jgi:hypothetical protein
MRKQLKVFSSPDSFVPNHEALSQGHLRFVGRMVDPTVGDPKTVSKFEGNKEKTFEVKPGGFVLKDDPELVPNRVEYRDALKEGSLLPADKETAAVVGLTFKEVSKDKTSTSEGKK